MKKYLLSFTAFFAITLGVLTLAPSPAYAQGAGVNVFDGACGGGNTGGVGSGSAGTGVGGTNSTVPGGSADAICGANKQGDFDVLMKNVINTILFVLGMIAVIMIVIGGIRYTTSNGESAQIQAAKNTIMYAVIGLVIAIMSYAIVNFVLERLG